MYRRGFLILRKGGIKMTEATDSGTEKDQEKEDEEKETSDTASGRDLAAEVKHFQSIADRRDSENKALREERDKLKAAQEAKETEALKEQEKYKELFEKTEAKANASEKAREALALQVELQTFLAENHPDYAPDFKWIGPHVDSKENIASVVEEYVKAHPKTPGSGTASAGNRGKGDDGKKTVSKADLADPAKSAALLTEDPDLLTKIAKGEIVPI
jgi:hypothetical protein